MRGDRLDYATERCWSTPRASDGEKGGPNQSFGAGGVPLPSQTANWPTPTALDRPRSEETLAKSASFRKRNANQNTVPLYLGEVAERWPTPDASVINDGESPSSFHARRERLKASQKNGNGAGTPLTIASTQWPTPTSLSFAGSHQPGNSRSYNSTMELAEQLQQNWMTPRVTTGDYTRDGGSKGSERLTLEGQAKWQTPSVADVSGGHASRSGPRKNELLLNGQAAALSSQQDQATSTLGDGSWSGFRSAYQRYRAETCSFMRSERRALLLIAIRRRGETWTRKAPSVFVRPSFRRSLNPIFVGDLMGWPPGLTNFACSEMASSIWRARMRCALSQLTYHPAPPAQLSLFG